jgi:hypothetical protein
LFASIYGVCCISGTLGNVWVLFVLLSELWLPRTGWWRTRALARSSTFATTTTVASTARSSVHYQRNNKNNLTVNGGDGIGAAVSIESIAPPLAPRRAASSTSNIVRRASHNYVRSYSMCTCLFVLSLTDLLFVLSIPMLVVDIYTTSGWIFGAVACKMFYFMEGLNKLYSPLVLTVLSADRYMNSGHVSLLSRSGGAGSRSHNTNINLALVIAFTLSMFILTPSIYMAGVDSFPVVALAKHVFENGSSECRRDNYTVQKCSVYTNFDTAMNVNGNLLNVAYDTVQFGVGYVCPLIFITIMYKLGFGNENAKMF